MQLSAAFLNELEKDGFFQVGMFGLREGKMYCEFSPDQALNESFTIYAFVGFSEGGRVMRIGKSESPVQRRIKRYPKDINSYPSSNTKPWEREEWFRYLCSFGSGLLFVKVLDYSDLIGSPDVILSSKKVRLRTTENLLIDKYDPPCCNDRSPTNKQMKTDWERRSAQAEPLS